MVFAFFYSRCIILFLLSFCCFLLRRVYNVNVDDTHDFTNDNDNDYDPKDSFNDVSVAHATGVSGIDISSQHAQETTYHSINTTTSDNNTPSRPLPHIPTQTPDPQNSSETLPKIPPAHTSTPGQPSTLPHPHPSTPIPSSTPHPQTLPPNIPPSAVSSPTSPSQTFHSCPSCSPTNLPASSVKPPNLPATSVTPSAPSFHTPLYPHCPSCSPKSIPLTLVTPPNPPTTSANPSAPPSNTPPHLSPSVPPPTSPLATTLPPGTPSPHPSNNPALPTPPPSPSTNVTIEMHLQPPSPQRIRLNQRDPNQIVINDEIDTTDEIDDQPAATPTNNVATVEVESLPTSNVALQVSLDTIDYETPNDSKSDSTPISSPQPSTSQQSNHEPALPNPAVSKTSLLTKLQRLITPNKTKSTKSATSTPKTPAENKSPTISDPSLIDSTNKAVKKSLKFASPAVDDDIEMQLTSPPPAYNTRSRTRMNNNPAFFDLTLEGRNKNVGQRKRAPSPEPIYENIENTSPPTTNSHRGNLHLQ